MQIWRSLTITLLSATAMLIDEVKCAERVTMLTNQRDVDRTHLPITLMWHRTVRKSPLHARSTLKARKIVERQDSEQNDTTYSPAAATTDLEHQQSLLAAERDDQAEQQESSNGNASSDTEQTEKSGNRSVFLPVGVHELRRL